MEPSSHLKEFSAFFFFFFFFSSRKLIISFPCIHLIMKTCLFKYMENFTSKNWKFSDKNSRRGSSNEYPQCFWAEIRGWSGVAKVLCNLRHRGVQLILVYSWARPAIFVAGKGTGGMFLFLQFIHFHSCSSFFPIPLFYLLYYFFSPFLLETTQNDPQGLTCC